MTDQTPTPPTGDQPGAQAAPEASAPAVATATTAPPPETSDKSFLATWLFALLLGGLAVDRFYLGKIGTAIAKLLTLGGLGVWVLIDVILVLAGAQRDKLGRPLDGYAKFRTMAWIVTGALVALSIMVSSVSAAGRAVDAVSDSSSTTTTSSQSDDESEADASGEPEPEEPAAPAIEDLAVLETAFGSDVDSDRWWYAVVLENPNADHVFPSAAITVEAVDADGVILDSDSNYTTVLQGQTVLVGNFFSVGSGAIAELDVRGPTALAATSSPAGETGSFSTSDIATTQEYGWVTVTGKVTSAFAEDQEYVTVSVIARDSSGTIVGSDFAYIERLPAGGTAQFESSLWDVDSLPGDVTFEAFAML